MTDGNLDDLNLDKASFDAPQGEQCTHCDEKLVSAYYEVNGNIVCPDCKETLAGIPVGSAASRFMKAGVFGLGTAAVGSYLYYLITHLSGMQIGLIAIGLGYVIGMAVVVGSGGRGGKIFQLLSACLTYASVGFAYLLVAYQNVEGGLTLGDNPLSGTIVVSGMALMMPILVGKESVISAIIIAIALWQAFKIPAFSEADVRGPFKTKENMPLSESIVDGS